MRTVLIAMALAALLAPCAMAQTPEQDRQREYYRAQDQQREEQQRRAQEEYQRQLKATEDDKRKRQDLDDESRKRQTAEAPGRPAQADAMGSADMRALGQKLLRTPPLPDERNILLGRWRLEGGGPQRGMAEFGLTGRGATPGFGEMKEFLSSIESGKLACDMSFGSGITFAPMTYSSGGAAGMAGGPIAYRSRNKNVIVAIPGDSRANPMPFTIAGPNRIVWADTCALVRVGAPGASAAANATTASDNARAGAANSTAPRAAGGLPQVAAVAPAPLPSTLSRPSPEVCRNNLLDKLGVVGTNQVRVMSDVRFKEAAIEGKVPNTNNLRIDLRGSACDDPRIKATLYDFDANEMLQSIT
ncbi:MAG: hypothetical protein ABI580_00105 [Burkholderiaceae bacterium]